MGGGGGWNFDEGVAPPGFFTEVRILKDLKSFVLEVRDLRELRAFFAEVRIVKELGLARQGGQGLRVDRIVNDNKALGCCQVEY